MCNKCHVPQGGKDGMACMCKKEPPVTDEQLQAAIATFNRASAEGKLEICQYGQTRWAPYTSYRVKPLPVGPDEVYINVYPTCLGGANRTEEESIKAAGRALILGRVHYIRAPE